MYGYHWAKIDVGHYWDLKGWNLFSIQHVAVFLQNVETGQ